MESEQVPSGQGSVGWGVGEWRNSLGANSRKDCFKQDCRGMCDRRDPEGPLR